MPIISVIMGTYDCKNFKALEKSIESIISQSFCDFEFIICIDGKPELTISFLKNIQKKDKRIQVISYEKNKGLSYALNECIKIARGDFIARQDDDDLSDENRLFEQYNFLKENSQFSFVGSNALIFDENGIWGQYRVPMIPKIEDFLWNSPFIHPTLMIRKDDLKNSGMYLVSKRVERCEDYELFMRLYSKKNTGYNMQKNLYKYRFSHDRSEKYRPMKYRINEMIVRYEGFKRMGIFTKGIPFIVKPFFVGMIPQKIMNKIYAKKYCK